MNAPCTMLILSGPAYLGIDIANQMTFSYTWNNAWHNLGIIFGYLVFFLGVSLATTEVQHDDSATGGVMIFERDAAPNELEQAGVSEGEKEAAAKTLETTSDIFTWRNVCYDVQIKVSSVRTLIAETPSPSFGLPLAVVGEGSPYSPLPPRPDEVDPTQEQDDDGSLRTELLGIIVSFRPYSYLALACRSLSLPSP
ncbi:hypothetical protein BCR35DRAFT_331544 [Leucosporidium creatinivorum]|uniref:CDR ABC transporter domain-containing protein n=1 Tax=Leucosporidium creatinivorum TaxID=106004 RepID=A0A1Y2FDT6_9BASI|nr:hypothetical protein BCR35DRAFT_331544 [Leucosporidium creatinivorum]